MKALQRSDLWSLEEYAEQRNEFRQKVIAHKKRRQIHIHDHARLYFEDEFTVRYQIQEMLRIERIFEAGAIQEELDAYNPLIPDGSNLKATFMIEYGDVEERRKRLAELIGVENRVWLQIGELERIRPICNEDLDRTTEEKTSSVHFMRFELTPAMVRAFKNGVTLRAGIDHPAYNPDPVVVDDEIRDALARDLDDPA